ncbi:MAG: SPFH domain-containing protein [Planctomycetota bacterium]|nr:SPFH domain-containing protein [Planctomycetota bacterium]
MNGITIKTSKEQEIKVLSGWPMLLINITLLGLGIWLLVHTIIQTERTGSIARLNLVGSILIIIASLIMFRGFFTLQSNEARVLILFGAYHGTVRTSGFHWANPFYASGPAVKTVQQDYKGPQISITFPKHRYKISLRARNFNSDKLKVNDKRGNPVEIAAVVVWRVADTAQATFDVDDYENYVKIQSESAIRHLASSYVYDYGEENEFTLRSSIDEVSKALREQLLERLIKAGVFVEEARLTHLAYAPEIAQAMLRRQQAEAIIAARQKIVHGAVSMVEMALRELSEQKVVILDDERKASMVSNLMVVLCGETEVHPVINTGTLYT